MNFKNFKKKDWYSYTIAICIGVVLFVILSNLSTILDKLGMFFYLLSPLTIGIVIAYVLDPLIGFFEYKLFAKIDKKRDLHAPAVVISLLIVVVSIYLILHSLIPQLIESVLTMAGNINTYTGQVKNMLEKMNNRKGVNIDVAKVTKKFNTIMNDVFEDIPKYAATAADISASIGGTLLNWLLGFILAIYFQFDKKRIVSGIQKFTGLLLGETKYRHLADFLDRCNDIMVRYITCEIIEGIIIGGINAVFMAIMKMPCIALISVLVGITNMIPSFGPIIGCAICSFILLLVAPKTVIAFVIFTFILQFFDGYILKPKMYGNSLGVPSMLILTFIILGGKFFGITGIILSIPAAAIICILYNELVIPYMVIWRMQKDKKFEEDKMIEFEEIEEELIEESYEEPDDESDK